MTKNLEDYITVPAQIAVLDFGGQYANLISKRIQGFGVRAKRVKSTITPDELQKMGITGIVLSGGPRNVSEAEETGFDPRILTAGKPILGICYGMQLIAHYMGGKVAKLDTREDGPATIQIYDSNCLSRGLTPSQKVWMSHGDSVAELPAGFIEGARSDNDIVASFYNKSRKIYGVQFHPEVNDTENGSEMLKQFVLGVCKCRQDYTLENRVELSGKYIQDIVGVNGRVFILVSGGVDSTVAAKLALNYLNPEQVYAIHIDNGFMRHEESSQVAKGFESFGFLPDRFFLIRAAERFYNADSYFDKRGNRVETLPLKYVLEPEIKRKIIGDQFISEAEPVIAKLGLNINNAFMMQGSLFTDLIESGSLVVSLGGADVIKTHHNDTALARKWREAGRMVEPNSIYYKDDVREIGRLLGLPPEMVYRQPFPGPGLAIRVICQTEPYLTTNFNEVEGRLEEVVRHLSERTLKSNLVPIRTVGVQGDARTYSYLALIQGEADWSEISRVATQLTKEQGIKGYVNRVAYLLTPKKPDSAGIRRIIPTSLTTDVIATVREAHRVVEGLMFAFGLERKIGQILTPLFPSDIAGEGQRSVAIRDLITSDWMTGKAGMPPYIPQEFYSQCVEGLMKIPGISSVSKDVTPKPPATTCWE